MTAVSWTDELLTECWFLCGPTAGGKSALALELAPRLNAEIVALDSMTLYRGMDIGTAKPTRADQQRVPHHLVDCLDPHEEFSLADFLKVSFAVCTGIRARGRRPLFVGGTGLYLRGLLRGVFEGPPADWELRRQLEERAANSGGECLHRELQQVDPGSAARLHPNDLRRVIRALEVFRLTGMPLSAQHQQAPRPVSARPAHVYWLAPPRDWLYHRIDQRVHEMVRQGLLQEVTRLAALDPPLSHTARQALGYKEVLDWLATQPVSAETLPDAVITEIQTRTRQFAKRQHTWFRNLEECTPIPITGTESAGELAEQLVARGGRDLRSL